MTGNLKASLKYIFWLGPLLIILGLSAGIVSGTWGLLPLGLLITGLVVLGLGVSWADIFGKGFWGRRSTQVGANAVIASLAFLVLIGLVNVLGVRYSTRIDLTEQRFFFLAPQSQQVLRNLKQPVKVVLFETEPQPAIRTLLESYQRQGKGLFRFEFIDPQAQPGLAQRYGAKNPGDVFLESGQRVEPLEEMFAEANLTPAIQRVTSDRRSQVYFIQGHGELPLTAGQGSLSEALKSLKAESMITQPLNLIQRQQIPADANVIVIAGAKQPFLDVEVKLLRQYLQQGGSLLLMLDPETKTGLEPLLQDWGIKLDSRLIVDASGSGQLVGLGPAVPLVTRYGQHPITKDFAPEAVSFFPLAQAVDIQPSKAFEVSPLLFTGDQSWAESSPDSAQLQFDSTRDRKGPLTLGVAIRRANQQPTQQAARAETRLVVIGDSDFATNGLIGKGLNGEIVLNAITWLSNRQDLAMAIRPKEAINRRLDLTPQTSRVVSLIALGLLPLAAFGTAGIFWWRQR